MKLIASIKKSENVRFVSHLDVQRMLQRTVRRGNIPISFSQGFNPHPLISFATALAVGQTGDGEWIEFRLDSDMPVGDFVCIMNSNLPRGFQVVNAYVAREGLPSISTLMVSADYTVTTADSVDRARLETAISEMLSGEIIVKKHKKQNGRKVMDAEVDIRPLVLDMRIVDCSSTGTVIFVKGQLDAASGLNVDLLMKALNQRLEQDVFWHIHRNRIALKEEL